MIRKYEFIDEAAADAAIDILRDEEGNLTENVVKLGYLVTTPATYEGDVEISPAIVSEKYAVDVYWSNRPHQDWQQYLVWPTPMGIHYFGSSTSREEYALAYCILFPNSTYCNPPDEEELYTE